MRLSVSHAHPDGVLASLLERIAAPILLDDVTDLETVVATLRTATTIDLIAHAVDGVLQLGAWELCEGEPHASRLPRTEGAMHLEAIRLIGCETARTERGRAAMRHLRRALGDRVKIYGSTSKVYPGNFDRDGFAFDGILMELADL